MDEFGRKVIETMCAHASVRQYTSEPVGDEDRKAVEEAVRAASSSCFLQLVTVVRITDPEKRRALAELSGAQAHVANAPEFWVFCADLHRDKLLYPTADTGWTEQMLVGALDVGIAAQSAMTALESLGLGGVFVGGLRNGIQAVDDLLELPEQVVPLLGLAFGHPARKNGVKPRLPKTLTFQTDVYHPVDRQALKQYDDMMREYYRTRPEHPKDVTWSETLVPILQRERRPFVREFLQKKGWAQK